MNRSSIRYIFYMWNIQIIGEQNIDEDSVTEPADGSVLQSASDPIVVTHDTNSRLPAESDPIDPPPVDSTNNSTNFNSQGKWIDYQISCLKYFFTCKMFKL